MVQAGPQAWPAVSRPISPARQQAPSSCPVQHELDRATPARNRRPHTTSAPCVVGTGKPASDYPASGSCRDAEELAYAEWRIEARPWQRLLEGAVLPVEAFCARVEG